MKNTVTTNTKLNDLKKLALKKKEAKMVKGGIVIGDWVEM
ncbi:MAG: hypothetical protein ACI9XO_000097 [Paraglaciecola sp.]|jgi:hypothetical protein